MKCGSNTSQGKKLEVESHNGKHISQFEATVFIRKITYNQGRRAPFEVFSNRNHIAFIKKGKLLLSADCRLIGRMRIHAHLSIFLRRQKTRFFNHRIRTRSHIPRMHLDVTSPEKVFDAKIYEVAEFPGLKTRFFI